MASVKVYRYDYYDSVLKHDRRSVDYATADAIMDMHGSILVETELSVDEDRVDDSGMIRAAQAFMERPEPRSRRPEHRPRG
jgi:hypothetical protein